MDSKTSESFGQQHFGGAALGHKARNKRLVETADRLVQHPGGTLPDKLADPADLKGLYRLVEHSTVTHASVLAPHLARTLQLMRECQSVVAIVHDDTVLDYSGLESLGDDLGQVGDGHGRGYYCHNSLAVVVETRQVLGLAAQLLHRRRKVPPGEKREQRRQRPDRESLLWKRGSQSIPVAPEGRLWVDVADRGADITEFLDYEEQAGKKYLVRSQHNRHIELENPEKPGETLRVKLHDWARSLPTTDERTLEVQTKPGQPARTARLAIAWTKVTLLPPRQPRGEERGVPLQVWVVRVAEIDPPAGVEPLEWILLTNVPVLCAADAWERVNWYRVRWVVEEYHKGQKTGCGIEALQFRHRDRLEPVIALLSVVALTLLELRDLSRRPEAQHQRAAEVLPWVWVRLLSLWRHQEERPDWTVHDFYFALARLGGHQNRRHDHPPGWLVLWRGWTKLQAMLEGAAAADTG
jgi:Transposase DNA-binding